jgi:hypothetical protein
MDNLHMDNWELTALKKSVILLYLDFWPLNVQIYYMTVLDYRIQNLTLILKKMHDPPRAVLQLFFLANCFLFILPSCLIKHANLDKTTAVHARGSANRLLNNNNND